jgi:glycine cleavage system aminomethyltransferase T
VLGLPVALAMVRGGTARIGESVTIIGDAGTPPRRAQIVAPVFYDHEGARLRG